jgi:replication factor C subunit 3/5
LEQHAGTRTTLILLATSDVGNWDRSVVQDILKEIAQTQQIDLNAKKRFKGMYINTTVA